VPQEDDQVWFDLNLAVMEDEPLVVLAQECEYGPARDELIVRYGAQTERLIGWMVYRYRLGDADADDARQNAVFWIVEAVNKYDTNQIGKRRGCSFRSFIHRVVMARFKDFTKHLRRVEGHYDRAARCGDETSVADVDRRPNDPAEIAEAHESINRLQETLTCLDKDAVRLWQLLASGNSLRKIAAELGVSYDSAKRRRRKLINRLRSQLSDVGADAPADTASET
jgi:RNA polymerase sigma factor (sigma-70 family)